MHVIPAIDLKDGCAVRLVGVEHPHERFRLDDPRALARQWADIGFSRLHIVDLDAASGRGSNRQVLTTLLWDRSTSLQVAGGVRTDDDVADLLGAGADAVVVEAHAIEDRDWLDRVATDYPNRIILGTHVLGRVAMTRDRSARLASDVMQLVDDIATLPLAGLLVTALNREGTMRGTDLLLMEDVAAAAPFPVIAAGGVGCVADLHALEDRGVTAAVVGMALYTGALDPRRLADDFPE